MPVTIFDCPPPPLEIEILPILKATIPVHIQAVVGLDDVRRILDGQMEAATDIDRILEIGDIIGSEPAFRVSMLRVNIHR